MKQPVVVVAGFSVVLAVAGAVLEAAWLWWLTWILWTYCLSSFAYARLASSGSVVDFAISAEESSTLARGTAKSGKAVIHEGDRLSLQVNSKSSAAFTGPIQLVGEVAQSQVAVRLLPPGRISTRHRFDLGVARRGEMRSGDVAVRVSDPLGLVSVQQRIPGRRLGIVFPSYAVIRPMSVPVSERGPQPAPTFIETIEVRGVRPWRSGDRLRNIHWPATAHRGQLMTKERDHLGRPSVTVLLEGKPSDVAVADQIARIAASEAFQAIADGCLVGLWWPEGQNHPPGALTTLHDILDVLAKYPEGGQSSGWPDRMEAAVAVFESRGASLELAERTFAQGGDARAWQVGGPDVQCSLPLRRVGTEWPL